MSAFFIAINKDHRPFDLGVAQAMMAQLDRFGDDSQKLVVNQHYAIGFQSTWTLPEEAGERQPLETGQDRWFVFYGRLDNRAELLSKLAKPSSSKISDAVLAQEYLQNVGSEFLSDLIGPFVLLDYDAKADRLLLARDGMGARHMVYKADQKTVLASSYEMALVAHPSVDYRLNDDTVGRHLVSQMQSGPSSIIDGLEVLHPGHSLEICDGEMKFRRFYKPDPKYRVMYASDDEYADEFKRLLNQAVERRLRCVGNIGSQLSGGLDSVPITIAAALSLAAAPDIAAAPDLAAAPDIAKEPNIMVEPSEARSKQQLSAYSWVFDHYPDADEREYSSPICSAYGIEQVMITCDTLWLNYCDTESSAVAPSAVAPSYTPLDPLGPIYNPFMSYNQALFSQAKARGVTVMLNGIHGDILYGYTQSILYELVKSGKFKDALAEARFQLIACGSVTTFIKEYLLKPVPITTRYLNWRASRCTEDHQALQPHIVEQQKHQPNYLESESRDAIRPKQWQVVLGEFAGRDAAIGRFLESEYSIERRYPFRDRDLCEFMLAIPSRQLAISGIKRPIVKRAFASELPVNMVNRNRKASFADVTMAGIYNDQKNAHWANAATREWSYYVKECYFDDKTELNHQLEVVKWRCGYYDYWKSVCYNPMAKKLGLNDAKTK